MKIAFYDYFTPFFYLNNITIHIIWARNSYLPHRLYCIWRFH